MSSQLSLNFGTKNKVRSPVHELEVIHTICGTFVTVKVRNWMLLCTKMGVKKLYWDNVIHGC